MSTSFSRQPSSSPTLPPPLSRVPRIENFSLLLFFHFAPIGFSNGDTMDSKNAKKTTIKENKMNSMKIGQESLKSKVRQKKAKVIITARWSLAFQIQIVHRWITKIKENLKWFFMLTLLCIIKIILFLRKKKANLKSNLLPHKVQWRIAKRWR